MNKYDNKIFLTFDNDWAHDEVLMDTINLLKAKQVPATFFVTNSTPVLEQFKNSPAYELGIHPNFNGLLRGENGKSIEEIMDSMLDIVPDATSIRSHSLAQNSNIIDFFSQKGMKRDLSLFIPQCRETSLAPFRLWNNLIRIPYFWEDDAECLYIGSGFSSGWDVNRYLMYPGLKIFNFHPIHVFLNTEDLKRYEQSRQCHMQPKQLSSFRYQDTTKGTRVFLQRLIDEAKDRCMGFGLVREIIV